MVCRKVPARVHHHNCQPFRKKRLAHTGSQPLRAEERKPVAFVLLKSLGQSGGPIQQSFFSCATCRKEGSGDVAVYKFLAVPFFTNGKQGTFCPGKEKIILVDVCPECRQPETGSSLWIGRNAQFPNSYISFEGDLPLS